MNKVTNNTRDNVLCREIRYLQRCCTLQWRHNECHGVSNHQPHDYLLNRLLRQMKENFEAPRHQPLCGSHRSPVNSPHKGPTTRKKVSIWWHHHAHCWRKSHPWTAQCINRHYEHERLPFVEPDVGICKIKTRAPRAITREALLFVWACAKVVSIRVCQ